MQVLQGVGRGRSRVLLRSQSVTRQNRRSQFVTRDYGDPGGLSKGSVLYVATARIKKKCSGKHAFQYPVQR
jgi:hypothetical protein